MYVGGSPPGQSAGDKGNAREARRGQHEGTILEQLLDVNAEAGWLHVGLALAFAALRILDQQDEHHGNDAQNGRDTQRPAPIVGQLRGLRADNIAAGWGGGRERAQMR